MIAEDYQIEPLHKSDAENCEAPPFAGSEAYRELCAMFRRHKSAIPEARLAQHVIDITKDMDWPVKLAATLAILQRQRTAVRDGLCVLKSPPKQAVYGVYHTGRTGDTACRPYRTKLYSFEPLDGSCNCPDFLKNSLGLCKHLLTVFEEVAASSEALLQLAREKSRFAPLDSLRWDAVRPPTGAFDPLHNIFLEPPAQGARVSRRGLIHMTNSSLLTGRLFERAGATSCRFVLRRALIGDPTQRRKTVRQLVRLSTLSDNRVPRVSGDPALTKLLECEQARLEIQHRVSVTASEVLEQLSSLKVKLFPYQEQGVFKFLETGRLLLADDMGLGKTAQAIAIAHVLFSKKRVSKVVVVTPAPLKHQWHREFGVFSHLPVTILEGGADERAQKLNSFRRGVLITNYEQVIRDVASIRELHADLIILDEAQRLKNWHTKTALLVKSLTPTLRLVLSGTPLENRIDELVSLMEWVDEYALAPVWRIHPWHTTAVDGKRGIGGLRNLSTFRARIAHCSLRRTRSAVLAQLPSRRDMRVDCPVTELQRLEHAEYDPLIAKLLRIAEKRPLTQEEFMRLMSYLTLQRLISNGLALYRFEEVWSELRKLPSPSEAALSSLHAPKLTEFRELIRNLVLEQGRKVVVFSQWRRMLELANWSIQDLLARQALRAVFFTGQEKDLRRQQNLIDFHDEPTVRILFATDAGGTGLNLQRAANSCINLEIPWNPAVLEQRIGRIYRHGQKDPIDTYCLLSEWGIEQRMLVSVDTKRRVAGELFEGVTDSVTFEGQASFLKRIELAMKDDISRLVPDVRLNGEDVDSEEESDLGLDAPLVSTTVVLGSTEAETISISSAPAAHNSQLSVDSSGVFSGLEIRRDADGSLLFRAPPDKAELFAQMFEGMAALLRASCNPSTDVSP